MTILLNVGAGGTLPGRPWINIDYPHQHPEMDNYLCHDVAAHRLPYNDGTIDGLIACHFLEHFECLQAVDILRDFHRVLQKDGVCRIVVPDASYHRKVYAEDVADPFGNAVRLFGEPLAGRELAKGVADKSFMSFALFWAEHKQVLTEDSLWCLLVQGGFGPERIYRCEHNGTGEVGHPWSWHVSQLDNRPLFSLRMEAYKL